MELIDSNLDGELRLSCLAEECGLFVSHFSRSFGVPVHRYLIARRVERAKFLLRSSSAPLAEIALESGFADQAPFSRSFRAVVGTSPMRWLNEQCTGCPYIRSQRCVSLVKGSTADSFLQ
jgi:AraC family transcriptional regulator